MENLKVTMDVSSGTEEVSIVDAVFLKALLSLWAVNLETASPKAIIGNLQDELRKCDTINDAKTVTKRWLHQRDLIEAATTNDFKKFETKSFDSIEEVEEIEESIDDQVPSLKRKYTK